MWVPKHLRRDLAIAGGVGAGLCVLRALGRTSPPVPDALRSTVYVRRNPAFVRIVAKLYELDQDELVDGFRDMLDHFLELDAHAPSSRHEAQRRSQEMHALGLRIGRELQAILAAAKKTHVDDVVYACVDFVSDEEELFETLVESITHNAMLDAA